MKQLLFICLAVTIFIASTGQALTEGKIMYERTTQLNIRLSGNDEAMAHLIPKLRTDRFELIFGDNQSLWKKADDEADNSDINVNSGGAQIQLVMPGADDILYYNFVTGRKTEKRELMDKSFLIQDSIIRLDWKLGNDTKTILGHTCKKATAQRMQTSFRIIADNGTTKKEEINDTLNIVAWYASDISNFGGPDMYQGQLPGLVLEIDVNNGRTTYIAKKISDKINKADLKEPKGGKKMTEAEFKKERQKMMDEMQRNGGGRFNIRRGNG
jgi:GLPGLI family protein